MLDTNALIKAAEKIISNDQLGHAAVIDRTVQEILVGDHIYVLKVVLEMKKDISPIHRDC